MHFALPNNTQRRSSPLLASPRSSSPSKLILQHSYFSKFRKRPLYIIVFIIFATLFWVLAGRDEHSRARARAPGSVLVVVLNRTNMTSEYSKQIVENRKKYAERWGYDVFVKDLNDYQNGPGPQSYAKLLIFRHAMVSNPYTKNFFYLSSNALIMNFDLSLEDHILSRNRLNSLMLRNHDVIPPQSIIKTYVHVDAKDIQIVLTQDNSAISTSSFIIRRREDEMPGKLQNGKSIYGSFLLDVWSDPLYKSYHFKQAERNALEHIIQWHPTILSKLAIIPQRVMNAYSSGKDDSSGQTDLKGTGYQSGDFVIHFQDCDKPESHCAEDFQRYYTLAMVDTK